MAIDDPQTAPNRAHEPIVALASAPRIPENTALHASNNSLDMLPRVATAPMRMNSGTTDSE